MSIFLILFLIHLAFAAFIEPSCPKSGVRPKLERLVALPWHDTSYHTVEDNIGPGVRKIFSTGSGHVDSHVDFFNNIAPPGTPGRAWLQWNIYRSWKGVPEAPCGLHDCDADMTVLPEDMHAYFNDIQISGKTCAGDDNETFALWWDQGAHDVAVRMHYFFSNFSDRGGSPPDWFLLDIEKGKIPWVVDNKPTNDTVCARMRWKAIEKDARFPAFRARLLELGPYEELYAEENMWKTMGNDAPSFSVVNSRIVQAAMDELAHKYYKESTWDPAVAYFPNVKGSDYSHSRRNASFPAVSKQGLFNEYGPGVVTGTHQSCGGLYQSIRGGVHGINGVLGEGKGTYLRTRFHTFMLDIQRHRANRLASPNEPTLMWIGQKLWNGDQAFPRLYFRGSFYWEEIYLHLIMDGADSIAYWNSGPQPYAIDAARVSLLMRDFEALGGACVDTEEWEMTALHDYWQPYAWSARRIEDRVLYRFTARVNETTGETIGVVQRNARPAVFAVFRDDKLHSEDWTVIQMGVRFRGSRRIYGSLTNESAPLGAWIESALNSKGVQNYASSVAIDWCNTTTGAYIDDCGVCSEGDTGHMANSDKCGAENLCFCEEFELITDAPTSSPPSSPTPSPPTPAPTADEPTLVDESDAKSLSTTTMAIIGVAVLLLIACFALGVVLLCITRRRRRRRSVQAAQFGGGRSSARARRSRSSYSSRVSRSTQGTELSRRSRSGIHSGQSGVFAPPHYTALPR